MNIIENESGLQDQPPAVEARPQDALSVLLARLRMANATQNPESDEAVVEPPWQRTVTARIFYWNLYGLPWCQCIGEPTDDDLRDESYLPRWEAKYREAESVSIPFIDTSSNEVIKKHWAAALSSCPNRWLFQEANMVFYIRVGAAVVPVTTGSDSELTGWYPILHHYAVNGKHFTSPIIPDNAATKFIVEEYLAQDDIFRKWLCVSILLTSGGPPRGTEITSWLKVNVATQRRSFFVVDDVILILSWYNKTQNMTGLAKSIARYLPPCLSTLLALYLVVVDPWVDFIKTAIVPT
ncbi:ATP-dependent DNA helicase tlh2 [Drechslerella dactyloides]|uniref:ATP-dependent DNA helicase tlh2 n=1 Tax=Drechslerella dactyloides TaxID=74499 RepID=A0AAD6J134_DREDA|nr:ATP-dependent DNA helicase tlh2 [Drechslerella dactyloides]